MNGLHFASGRELRTVKTFWQLWNERHWTRNPCSINPFLDFSMFKRNCVVKFADSFVIEHAAKVEAESLFEAAVRGLHRLDMDLSFWTEEDVFDRMCVTVEVHEEPTTQQSWLSS